MSKTLQGKVAVITGASHGLGLACAHNLGSLGADLVLIGRDQARLDETAASLKSLDVRVLAQACDISQGSQVQASAEKIIAEMGRVDILLNNAGIPAPRTFAETQFEDWDAVMGTNLSGAFYMTRALWDAMIASGAAYVINISGTAGLRGGGSPAYGSSKYGLTALTHAIAAAGKEHNLRATVLYPGGMDTGWRGAPIGEKPRSESMDPDEVARFIGQLVLSPQEFVINEAVMNPIDSPFM